MGSWREAMGKRNTDPLPEEVDLLRMEIQEWRRTKSGAGAAMPQELWETAVRLGRAFGVCRIARATGLDYVRLRKKLERRMGTVSTALPASSPTFLELPVDLVLPGQGGAGGREVEPSVHAGTGTLIEVAAADGARMRIQLGSGSLDAAGVVAAFLGGSR